MNLAIQTSPLSVDDYLQGEGASDFRHEYVAGEVFAMAGAGERHNRISLNLAFHLRAATRGTPCGVYISDMKVRVVQHDAFYYPDVILACEPSDAESLYKSSPCLIAEVLSPSTEAIDRREKLIAYRSLASLRYYILISQDSQRVELFTRDDEARWQHTVYEGTGTLEVHGPGVTARFTLADIYEDASM